MFEAHLAVYMFLLDQRKCGVSRARWQLEGFLVVLFNLQLYIISQIRRLARVSFGKTDSLCHLETSSVFGILFSHIVRVSSDNVDERIVNLPVL